MAIQGTDIPVEITITDSAGVAINLSAYPGIAIYLFDKEERIPIIKFSRIAAAGFTTISTVVDATGKIQFSIPKATSLLVADKEIIAEVRLRATAGTYSAVQVSLGTIEFSNASGETIP
jgi:hypothetical protein